MIGTMIYTALSTSSPVTALVSTRIYPVVVPQTVAMPALCYAIAGNIPTNVKDGASTLDKFTFEVYCMSNSYAQVDDLAEKVRNTLEAYTNSSVQSIRYVHETDDYDESIKTFIRTIVFNTRVKR